MEIGIKRSHRDDFCTHTHRLATFNVYLNDCSGWEPGVNGSLSDVVLLPVFFSFGSIPWRLCVYVNGVCICLFVCLCVDLHCMLSALMVGRRTEQSAMPS